MPIRLRLALGFAVATLAISTVAGVLFERSFRSGVEESLEPGLRSQAVTLDRALRASAEGAIGLDQPDALLPTGELVAQILDERGNVLEATREAGATPVLDRTEVRQATTATVFTEAAIGREGEPFRILARSTTTDDGPRIVVTGTSLESTNEAVARVQDALVFGGLAAVLVAGAGAWVLAGAALRPVERMRRQAAGVSEGDEAPRLPVPRTRDELAALAATLNDMLGRLHDALDRERRFVADAGHELRTPLAVLRTELELAARRPRTKEELMATVTAAQVETERIARLTEELLFLASTSEAPAALPRQRTELAPIVEAAVAGVLDEARERSVDVRLEVDRSIEAPVAPALLRRAVENLLDNSLRCSSPGHTVHARLHREDGQIAIEVVDAGPGFPVDFLPHAFERFRRADTSRSRGSGGTGLGLAIVLAIARAHGGTAVAANRPEGGAVVGLRLPGD